MECLIVSNRKNVENATFFYSPKELYGYPHENSYIDTLIFAFWGWKVEDWMVQDYKCYGMHTGFLLDKKGAGGSPIDNLKNLNVKWAALNVFEMNNVLDGGRVRLAIPINIEGSKEDVISLIDTCIPDIVEFLKQDISHIPEKFLRIKNV